MFTRTKKYSLIVLGALIFCSAFFAPVAHADDFGLKATADQTAIPTDTTIPKIVGNVIGQGLSLISVLFFILMLYGGFVWMTAQGNSQQENKAKDIIISAIIGILIVLAAYTITNFVFTNLAPPASTGGGGGGTTTSGVDSSACKSLGISGIDCISSTDCSAEKDKIKQVTDVFDTLTAAQKSPTGKSPMTVIEGKAGVNNGCYGSTAAGNSNIKCCLK